MSNATTHKKSAPLSLIGKIIHFIVNLILLALFAWVLLLLFVVVSVLIQGWESAVEFFEKALRGMTVNLWAINDGSNITSIFFLVTQFVIERCQIFLRGSVVIVAFAVLGFVDGLVQRDIRKFQNARESTLFFHRSKSFFVMLFFISYFLFIAIPINIPLSYCLIIIALISSYGIQVTTKQFKKHL